jgi:transposase
VHKTSAVDLARITSDDELLRALELSIIPTATKHEANTLHLLQTVPGIGKILSLVLLYELHHMDRFPRGQDFASSCRLLTCAQASAGKRLGTSGTNIGTAHLKWALSDAAIVFLRNNPHGPQYLVRLENKHDKGKARTILAHQLARAVYDMLKRKTALERARFRRASERRAGEPAVYLDTPRNEPDSSVLTVLFDGVWERPGVHLGLVSLSLTG